MNPDVSDAFVELLTSHQTRLQSYIASMLGNPESTWDVLQETNRVLIEKQAKFQMGTSFLNWALTVAQFQTMAWLRDQKRDRHVMTPEIAELVQVDDLFDAWKTSDERIVALEKCVQGLSVPHRELIRCRYTTGDSLAKIAERTAVSVNSLKQAFFRLRRTLATCVQQKLEAS